MTKETILNPSRKTIRVFWLIAIVVIVAGNLGLTSCATTPTAATRPTSQAAQTARDPDVFTGMGQSDSLLKAMNLAKMDAVKKLIVDKVGSAAEQANQSKLQAAIYGSNNPNQFISNDTMNITRKDSTGTMDNPHYVIEMTIQVRRNVVEQTLANLGITGKAGVSVSAGGQTSPKPNASTAPTDTAAQQLATTSADIGTITDEQRAFIRKYVDRLNYMVYFSDTTNEKDQFLLKTAVTQANAYLASNGYSAVDSAQVEKLKKDKALVYEEQTGGQTSMIQWIAQSLNADVYLEIDASTTSEAKNGNFYGQAIITVKLFETSTGQLLGAQPYTSPKTISKVDQTDAVSNALQSSIYAVMPLVIDQSKTLLAKQFAGGIHYEVIIQKPSDARVISSFRSKLKRQPNITDVTTRSQSADELVLDVYYFGRSDDLSDMIMEMSGTISGLENIDLVLSRGKSLTFNSGM